MCQAGSNQRGIGFCSAVNSEFTPSMMRQGLGGTWSEDAMRTPKEKTGRRSPVQSPVFPTPASWSGGTPASQLAQSESPPGSAYSGASQDVSPGRLHEDTQSQMTPSPSPPPSRRVDPRTPLRNAAGFIVHEGSPVHDTDTEPSRSRSRSVRRSAAGVGDTLIDDNHLGTAQSDADVDDDAEQSIPPDGRQPDSDMPPLLSAAEEWSREDEARVRAIALGFWPIGATIQRSPPRRSRSRSLRNSQNSMPQESRSRDQSRPRVRNRSPREESPSKRQRSSAPTHAQNETEVDAATAYTKEELKFNYHFMNKVRIPKEKTNHTKRQAKESLYELAAKNGFDMRGAVGNHWSRGLKDDPELAERYNAMKGQKNMQKKQREFREGWAKEKYTAIMKSSDHVQSWKKVDTMHGEFFTFELLITKYGNNRSSFAIDCATKYASKCRLMGSPWMDWDEMAECNAYLYMKRQFTQSFSECWNTYMSFTGHKDIYHIIIILTFDNLQASYRFKIATATCQDTFDFNVQIHISDS